ncbi:DUF6443 domain-containing protein [Pedobacter aquatilis]|uniref:DUF6443 domain-containing protein n=1 Tax=Pedobacter aquatilis TaxID=351343 RepID=UPI0025B3F5D2|nr:DUF6443 domain-containing protein [Pedobacter aquatilis]MDN3588091.1 DUF6443 domain-containing protein [Pedobacter aquatilis]
MKFHFNKIYLAAFGLLYCSVNAQQHLSLSTYSGQSEIKATGSITLTDGFHATGNVRIYITPANYVNCFNSSFSPSSTQNYILTRTYKLAGVNYGNFNSIASVCDVNQKIQYIDGLGRPVQTIDVQGSPLGNDIIQPVSYDGFGREKFKFLPYTEAGNNGAFRTNALTGGQSYFYLNASNIAHTLYPFTETGFEASPLNRVLQQGAAGLDWQISSGHTIKTDYATNISGIRRWNLTSNGASAINSFYAIGKLLKTITKDENWKASDFKARTTEEFKDLEGRVILKRVWETDSKSLSTYYVYDDLGNLRYVLPPAVNENGTASLDHFSETDQSFDFYIYGYHYDNSNRVIEKKIPGKGWEEMIYNPNDQVVFTQDAIQRQRSERAFVKYDALGRVAMTGIEIGHTGTRADVQGTVNSLSVYWDTRDNGTGNLHGYNNVSAPAYLPNLQPQIINYYDNYDIPGLPFNYISAYSTKTKGLLTATKVKVLGTNDFLWTVNYYDNDGRIAKSYTQHYLSGSINNDNYDETSNTWSFAGELTASSRIHHTAAGNTVIDSRFGYDHLGRKIASWENINNQGEVALSKSDYNEIGQLIKKNLHSKDGSAFLQYSDFAYNERGWLKSAVSNQFSMQLDYQENGSQMFNGNISKQSWSPNTNLSTPNYLSSYSYDKLNRLNSAVSSGLTMHEFLTYDEMGNIKTLKRDNGNANLYHYNGNRLWYAENVTNGYVYDANGNAVVDGRTGYHFSYNHLNLPQSVSNGVSLTYTYDASGNKLRKSSVSGTVNYINGIQYKADNSIDFIQTEEGVARNNGGIYSYEYDLKDHLGNTRASFYKNPSSQQLEVMQRDDYYAFGLRKSGIPNSNNNKYLYNGKELQEELGQYDYGARFYDPVIGRWTTIDPLVELNQENTSPYIYVLNNPILLTDPDGRFPDGPGDDLWDGVKQGFTGYFGGIKQAVLNPVETVKSQFTTEAITNNLLNTATFGTYGMAKEGITVSSAAAKGDLTALGKAIGSKAAEGLVVGVTEGAGRVLGAVTKVASKEGSVFGKSPFIPKDAEGVTIKTVKTKAGNTKIDAEGRGVSHTQLREDASGNYAQRTTFDAKGRKRSDTHFTTHGESGKSSPHKHTYYKNGKRSEGL